MARLLSFGKVTCALVTSRERLTQQLADPTTYTPSHSFFVQQVAGNTGYLYIGTATMNTTTLAGVYGVVPPPTATNLPFFSSVVINAPGGFDLSQVYLAVSVAGEAALVSTVEA